MSEFILAVFSFFMIFGIISFILKKMVSQKKSCFIAWILFLPILYSGWMALHFSCDGYRMLFVIFLASFVAAAADATHNEVNLEFI